MTQKISFTEVKIYILKAIQDLAKYKVNKKRKTKD